MAKLIAASILIAMSAHAVMATVHTTCFNYFLQKDGCVFSSASAKTRCPAPAKDHPAPVHVFTMKSQQNNKRSDEHTLQRRYDTTQPSFAVAGGNGICGFYDSKTALGVCLWSGAEQNSPTLETAGWLNGLKTSNCGKRIYIQRTGQPQTVQYVKVLDGCSFNSKDPADGCFQVGLTIALFDKFNPTAAERAAGVIQGGITWDYDNLNGNSPQQGPV